jgi:NAD(P)-dependent dehydrogenase (short-subunit alcohol dehydrogenase family)
MSADKKVVIITGASQGIGEALLRAYRNHGFRVVANSRSIKPLSDPDVLTVAGDIGNPETAERIISQALERFGRVDTLVNNAGIFVAKPFTEYTDEDYAHILEINLNGFFHITRRAAKKMLKQGAGHIVQITTSLDVHASSNTVLAALTKGGLNAATRALAIEYASRGVRVNAVAPGAIKTPMHAPETHEFLAKQHPIGRMGEVRDVVDAVLYLEGAAFIMSTADRAPAINCQGGTIAAPMVPIEVTMLGERSGAGQLDACTERRAALKDRQEPRDRGRIRMSLPDFRLALCAVRIAPV